MTNASKTTTNAPNIGGTESEDVATVQESVPLPYVAGTRKVAARWISNTYNQFTQEVEADSGKKGGGDKGSQGSGTYDYFGSIGAAVCNGPVDNIVAVIIDGEQVWADPNEDASRDIFPDKFVGSIAGHGTFHFYWGVDNQELDSNSRLKSNNKGIVHPDYKGTAIIELRDFLFGREKVSAPNLEVVVQKGAVQSILSVTSIPLEDGQINPMLPVADLLTNKRYGLGLDDSLFDPVSFQTMAESFRDSRTGLVYCSPLLNKQESLKSVLSDFTALTDAFFIWDSVNALIQVKSWPHEDSVDTDLLPSIIDEDLVDMPNINAEGWSGVKTGWDVSFADRERMYKESSERFDELSLLGLTGQPNRESLKREWITRRNQALAYAMDWAKANSRPVLEGGISVRRTSVKDIHVGDLFKLDIDAEPSGSRLNQVVRMLNKTYKETGAVACSFEAETNLIPQAYAPPSTLIPDEESFPAPDQLTYVRPFEMPPTLSRVEYGMAVLAQREDGLTVGYDVLYDSDDVSGEFTGIGVQKSFGVYATLSESFSGTAKGADEAGYDPDTDAPVLDITNSNLTDLLNMPDDLGLIGARNDNLLLVLLEIDSVTGAIELDENGYAIMEVLSVSAITTNLDESRSVQALRGRFSTGTRSFSSGAEAWLIRKKGLTLFTHKDFESAVADQTPVYFKIRPFNVFRSRDISEDSSVEFLFPESRFFAPRISYTLPPDGPFVGVPYSISGTITDQDGDLASWEVAHRGGGASEVNVAGGPTEPTSSFPFVVPITFTKSGEYTIYIRAQDSTTFVDGYVEEEIVVNAAVTTSAISAPSDLTASNDRFNSIWLTWTNPEDGTDAPFSNVEIMASTTNDIATASLVITTSAEFASYPVEDADTRYFWIRARDTARNFSTYAQPDTAGVEGSASVDVDAGVEVVDVLPDTDNFDGRVVYLTTEDKLYRYVDPTGWDSAVAVDADDITGEIGESQIAANAVTADKILAGAITAGKIAANAVTADKILAGAITAGKIGASAVTAEKINAGAVTAEKIEAGAVTADKISGGTIDSAEIVMNGTSSIIRSSTFSDTDGWRIRGDGQAKVADLEVRGNATVGTGADGILAGDIITASVELYSPDDLELDNTGGEYNRVRLLVKRPAGGTGEGRIWFKTGTDTTWAEAKSKTFTMSTGDTDYQVYVVDMSTV
jgi:hypothetical protein